MPLGSVGRVFDRANLNSARCLKLEIKVVAKSCHSDADKCLRLAALGKLQLSTSLLALFGEHIKSKGSAEYIRLGHPLLSCKRLKAGVELFGDADLKASGSHGEPENIRQSYGDLPG